MFFDFDIIRESMEPLRKAFGFPLDGNVKLYVVNEEILKIVVQIPSNYQDPEAALRRFDEAWWIDNCHRANGNLVFDYEVTVPQP